MTACIAEVYPNDGPQVLSWPLVIMGTTQQRTGNQSTFHIPMQLMLSFMGL